MQYFMPYFIQLIAPGFIEDEEKFSKLVYISRIIFPFLIFISISSIYSSILNLGPLNLKIVELVITFSLIKNLQKLFKDDNERALLLEDIPLLTRE